MLGVLQQGENRQCNRGHILEDQCDRGQLAGVKGHQAGHTRVRVARAGKLFPSLCRNWLGGLGPRTRACEINVRGACRRNLTADCAVSPPWGILWPPPPLHNDVWGVSMIHVRRKFCRIFILQVFEIISIRSHCGLNYECIHFISNWQNIHIYEKHQIIRIKYYSWWCVSGSERGRGKVGVMGSGGYWSPEYRRINGGHLVWSRCKRHPLARTYMSNSGHTTYKQVSPDIPLTHSTSPLPWQLTCLPPRHRIDT